MAYGSGVSSPFGLRPSNFLTAATFNNQLTQYYILHGYNTNLFQGDPVYVANTGTIAKAGLGAGNPILGSFQGCFYIDASGNPTFSPYWPANTAVFGDLDNTAFAYVTDDPNIYYDVQAGSNSAQGIIQTALFDNANLLAGAGGSTLTYQSSVQLDAPATANPTYQMKVMSLTPVPGNAFGIKYNNALCFINNHPAKGGTGTDGAGT